MDRVCFQEGDSTEGRAWTSGWKHALWLVEVEIGSPVSNKDWVGQKIHSAISIPSSRKIRMTVLANPVVSLLVTCHLTLLWVMEVWGHGGKNRKKMEDDAGLSKNIGWALNTKHPQQESWSTPWGVLEQEKAPSFAAPGRGMTSSKVTTDFWSRIWAVKSMKLLSWVPSMIKLSLVLLRLIGKVLLPAYYVEFVLTSQQNPWNR